MSRNQLTIAIGLGLAAVLAWIFLSGEPERETALVHAGPGRATSTPAADGGTLRQQVPGVDRDQDQPVVPPAATGAQESPQPPRSTDLSPVSGAPGVRRRGLEQDTGPEPSQLDITVRDAMGDLVPGVVVRAYIEDPGSGSVQASGRTSDDHGDLRRSPTTDANGRCWIDVPAGSALRLVVRDDDGATLTGSLRVAALDDSEVRGVELRMRAGKTIMQQVTAVNADTGDPAAGAVGWVLPRTGNGGSAWELADPDARGGASGNLAVSRTTDRRVVLVVGAADRAPVALALHGNTGFDDVSLRVPLQAGAGLEIVARDGAGRPVAGASVTVLLHLPCLAVDEGRPLPDRQLQLVKRTDSFGQARFEGLPPSCLLTLRCKGLLGLPEQLQLEPGEDRILMASSGGGVPITGRVTDVAGTALADETLWLVPADTHGPTLFPRERELDAVFLRTDAEGRFAHDNLPAGSWWIGPSPLGDWVPYGTHLEVTLPSPAISMDLIAHAPRFLEGRVVDAKGAQALGAMVQATGPGGLSPPASPVSTEGRFRIGPLPPGAWTVHALPGRGHHGSRVAGAEVSDDAQDLELRLRRGAGLRATAIDEDGTFIEAFEQVLLTDIEGRVRSLVGEDATLEHVGLANGNFAICAVLPDGRIALSEDVPTRAGTAPADVVLQFHPTARLEFAAQPEAVPFRIWFGATCVALGRTLANAPTGIDVPAGTLTIEWRFPQGAQEQTVTVAPEARHALEIRKP